MKSAYAAGRYAKLTDENGLKNFPYWQYVHGYYGKPNQPRDEHVSWDGMILPANHPWFDTHFPPNGWGCHCGIKPLTKEEAERTGRILEKVPEEFDNNKGIGEGWAGNPGKANNPVNAVFDSVERFRQREPKLYDEFQADWTKNIGNYVIDLHNYNPNKKHGGFEQDEIKSEEIYELYKKSGEWKQKLTLDERQAFRRYTDYEYAEVNGVLRGMEKMTENASKKIDAIKNAVSKYEVKEPKVLFRSDELRDFKIGEYVDNAFLSTTTDAGKAISAFHLKKNNVLMKILLKKGASAAPISEMSNYGNEFEWLINTGTKKRVLSIENVSDLLKKESSVFLKTLQSKEITQIITLEVE
jgi:hypothetical protein